MGCRRVWGLRNLSGKKEEESAGLLGMVRSGWVENLSGRFSPLRTTPCSVHAAPRRLHVGAKRERLFVHGCMMRASGAAELRQIKSPERPREMIGHGKRHGSARAGATGGSLELPAARRRAAFAPAAVRPPVAAQPPLPASSARPARHALLDLLTKSDEDPTSSGASTSRCSLRGSPTRCALLEQRARPAGRALRREHQQPPRCASRPLMPPRASARSSRAVAAPTSRAIPRLRGSRRRRCSSSAKDAGVIELNDGARPAPASGWCRAWGDAPSRSRARSAVARLAAAWLRAISFVGHWRSEALPAGRGHTARLHARRRAPVPRGDEVIAPINRLGTQFEDVVLTQDWHPRGHISFASAPRKEALRQDHTAYGEQVLWPDHCVQGTPGRALHRRSRCRTRSSSCARPSPRRRQLFRPARGRSQDANRARRLPPGTRLHPAYLAGLAGIAASPGPRPMRRPPASR